MGGCLGSTPARASSGVHAVPAGPAARRGMKMDSDSRRSRGSRAGTTRAWEAGLRPGDSVGSARGPARFGDLAERATNLYASPRRAVPPTAAPCCSYVAGRGYVLARRKRSHPAAWSHSRIDSRPGRGPESRGSDWATHRQPAVVLAPRGFGNLARLVTTSASNDRALGNARGLFVFPRRCSLWSIDRPLPTSSGEEFRRARPDATVACRRQRVTAVLPAGRRPGPGGRVGDGGIR